MSDSPAVLRRFFLKELQISFSRVNLIIMELQPNLARWATFDGTAGQISSGKGLLNMIDICTFLCPT